MEERDEMTQSALIPHWTPALRAGLMSQPIVFDHGLLETGLFTEEAIARRLETHPDDLTDVNINDIYEDGTSRVRTGTRGGLSGKDLLDQVKAGRLWINLRQAFVMDGSKDSLADRFFRELEAHNPGLKITNVYANLLISGPQARVPYHADTPGVVLMHLIGKKRLWVFPNHGKFLEDDPTKRVALRETTEDLPYNPAWDGEAQCFDLQPGQTVAWPYNAPHKVDNLGTFNVSLSCEYMTWEGRLRHGVYYTNGTLRRRFGMNPPTYQQTSSFGRILRWAMSVVFKRLKLNKTAEIHHATEFDLADSMGAKATAAKAG
jgi:hypothetical protein